MAIEGLTTNLDKAIAARAIGPALVPVLAIDHRLCHRAAIVPVAAARNRQLVRLAAQLIAPAEVRGHQRDRQGAEIESVIMRHRARVTETAEADLAEAVEIMLAPAVLAADAAWAEADLVAAVVEVAAAAAVVAAEVAAVVEVVAKIIR